MSLPFLPIMQAISNSKSITSEYAGHTTSLPLCATEKRVALRRRLIVQSCLVLVLVLGK
jgi:hypothetical protein